MIKADNLARKCGHRAKSAPPLRPTKQGFTLVEVMVAMAIVALALPALLGQISSQVDHTAYMRDKSVAQWVAQNQLEILQLEYALNQKLLKGSASGSTEMAGRTWYWQVNSEATVVPGMWRETVTVGTEAEEALAFAVGFIAEAELEQNPSRNPGAEN